MKNNGPWIAALALAAAMPVAADAWIAITSHDRMTGENEVLGVYAQTRPEEPRPSGYGNIYGMLIFDCTEGAVFFQILDEFKNFEIEDRKSTTVEFLPRGTGDWIEIRARFDNEPVQWLSAYTFGERNALTFVSAPELVGFNGFDMLSLAEGRRRLLLEVPSVKGDLYFDFDLEGGDDTLHEAYRKHCG